MPADGEAVARADRAFLLRLQRQALQYFLENQVSGGLIRDRQANQGARRSHGLCSTAATGMGFIALALATAAPYRLLSPAAAARRVRAGLETVLGRLPHDRGVVPHFLDPRTGAIWGHDHCSTVETAWVAAGALWAAAFLRDRPLEALAQQLYRRIDWSYWTAPNGLLRHGKGPDGRFLPCCWDRVNGETVFMVVLAAGADAGRAMPAHAWAALRPFYGEVAGRRFNNADLGLFVFQYGLDLLDLEGWRAPGTVNLAAEARLATEANLHACRQLADRFATYRRYWGLSAGDGPGEPPRGDSYRAYAPSGPLDGTAHVTATLASIAQQPAAVLENLRQAERAADLPPRGRYGFSNVNVDRGWVSRDVVAIDLGAAVLALDNFLMAGRVRAVFHRLPCVRRGLQRLGFVPVPALASTDAEPGPDCMREAS